MWTIICGTAHVLASVLLASGGAALGFSLGKIDALNDIRGGLASWAVLIFGMLYFLYGLYGVYKKKSHKHFDVSDDGSVYVSERGHKQMTYPTKSDAMGSFLDFPVRTLRSLISFTNVSRSRAIFF